MPLLRSALGITGRLCGGGLHYATASGTGGRKVAIIWNWDMADSTLKNAMRGRRMWVSPYKTIQANLDVCFMLIILIAGCTERGDIENNQFITITTNRVNKLSTNELALKIDDENKTLDSIIDDRKVVHKIEINEIFKQNDIHKLIKVTNDGFDLVSIASVRGKLGITPLHVASENGSNEILEYLNDFGANFNIQDNGGRTLLHTAIIGNRISTVKLLLKMDVNLNLKNKQGYTALDVFLINKDTLDKEIYSVLTGYNAKKSIELKE